MDKEVYKNLLVASNKHDRLDARIKVECLSTVLGLEELKSRVNYYKEFLCDEDLDVVLHAWQLLPKVLKLG